MGLFPHSVDDALKAVIELYAALKAVNDSLKMPIQIGVGIHYGPVTMGTVGTRQRMETTVLGDSVNLASRLEAPRRCTDCGCSSRNRPIAN
jgi:class 3 adenylate cyclase